MNEYSKMTNRLGFIVKAISSIKIATNVIWKIVSRLGFGLLSNEILA
jgi:hypothetical protein